MFTCDGALSSVASTGNIVRTSSFSEDFLRMEGQRESGSGWSRASWVCSRCQWLAWRALEGQVTLLACLFWPFRKRGLWPTLNRPTGKREWQRLRGALKSWLAATSSASMRRTGLTCVSIQRRHREADCYRNCMISAMCKRSGKLTPERAPGWCARLTLASPRSLAGD